jgi:hypothetical protein
VLPGLYHEDKLSPEVYAQQFLIVDFSKEE